MSRLPLYLAQFFSGVVWVTLGPLLDSVLRDLDIPLAQGGVPALAFFLGTVSGAVALNFLLARVPVRLLLVAAALLETVGLTAAGLLSQGLWSFTAAYFVAGLPCMVISLLPGMWVSAHLREKAAYVLSIVMTGSVLSMLLTPLVIGALLGAGVVWRWVLVGEAVLSVLLAVTFALRPVADIPGRENLRLRQVKAVVSHNPKLLAGIAATSFMFLGGETVLGVWLPKFEVDVFGASATWASLALTFYWVGQLLGRAVGIPITRKRFPSSILVFSAVWMVVFVLVLAFSPNQIASLALTFGAGLGVCVCYSVIGSYASKFPHWHSGVVYSLFQFSGGVGAMVFPYLTGPVAAAWGFRAALAMAAVPAAIVIGLAFYLRKVAGEGFQARS
ncbi:MAG: MFS transporter [Thermoleophilia bacterium]|nr:MFS transporter [Thermoleophilia bacterium]